MEPTSVMSVMSVMPGGNQEPSAKKFPLKLLLIALALVAAAGGFYFWQTNTPEVIPFENRLQAPLNVLKSQSKVQPVSIMTGQVVKAEVLPISLKFLEKDAVDVQILSVVSAENKAGYKIHFVENKPVDIYRYYHEFVGVQQFKYIDGFYNKIAGLINMENQSYLLRIEETTGGDNQTEVNMLLISK